jgi:hypothetical protein
MYKFRFTRMHYYDSNHAVVISFIADKTFMGLDNKINTVGGVFKKQELCIYSSQATWCIPFLIFFYFIVVAYPSRAPMSNSDFYMGSVWFVYFSFLCCVLFCVVFTQCCQCPWIVLS